MGSPKNRALHNEKDKTIGGLSASVHERLMAYKKSGGFRSLNDALLHLLDAVEGPDEVGEDIILPPAQKRMRPTAPKSRERTEFLHQGWTFEFVASLPTYFKYGLQR